MREHKYRAWDKKEGRWLGVNLHMSATDGCLWWQFGYGCEILSAEERENIELVQYTEKKDIDGKEIYEGDIVIFKYNSKIIPKEAGYKKIVYKHCCFGYEPLFPELCHPDDLGFHPLYDFEDGEKSMDEPILILIGTTYKNPELIKEADQ